MLMNKIVFAFAGTAVVSFIGGWFGVSYSLSHGQKVPAPFSLQPVATLEQSELSELRPVFDLAAIEADFSHSSADEAALEPTELLPSRLPPPSTVSTPAVERRQANQFAEPRVGNIFGREGENQFTNDSITLSVSESVPSESMMSDTSGSMAGDGTEEL